MNSQECTTCMNHQRNPVFDYGCSHCFCKYCISAVMENVRHCPQCRQEKLFPGNQPVGCMTWRNESRKWLPGYETYGTIVVTFNFKGGIQGSVYLKLLIIIIIVLVILIVIVIRIAIVIIVIFMILSLSLL